MRSPATTRRAVVVAVVSAGAGCLTGQSPGTPTGSQTTGEPTTSPTPPTPSETPADDRTRAVGDAYETAEGWTVTVENVAVRHGVRKFGTVHVDPVWADGAQFVVADVVVDGDGPDVTDLDVAVEVDTLDRSGRIYVHSERNADETRQRFGYAVPTDPAPERAALVWRPNAGPTVRWALDSAAVRALGAAPEFSVESFTAPETATGSELETTLTVRNAGERDGRFLAEVGDAAMSDQPEFALDVPAGETATGRPTVSAHFDDDEVTVVLRWENGTKERRVRRSK
ncbi:hypothetical protein ACFQJD_05430 [Haloplanus sp. GCM10025708]|uniref:hypothetical protein n=1 Tax=Haloferacaceae TaxID=1644056 RepID=UPI00360F9E42